MGLKDRTDLNGRQHFWMPPRTAAGPDLDDERGTHKVLRLLTAVDAGKAVSAQVV